MGAKRMYRTKRALPPEAPRNGEEGYVPGSRGKCRACTHPGRAEIDVMLVNGTQYRVIITRMKECHPKAPLLSTFILSRHKTRDLLTQPIMTTEVDPDTGETRQAYLTGHLSNAPLVPRTAIPSVSERVAIPDALAIIINAGVKNALARPELVSMHDLTVALELARKMGLQTGAADEFKDAWAALGEKKRGEKQTKRRKVTIEEETTSEGVEAPRTVCTVCNSELPVLGAKFCPECGAQVGVTITDVTPGEWSADDLKYLGGPDETPG